jgi:PAS domain S-box-containing protein
MIEYPNPEDLDQGPVELPTAQPERAPGTAADSEAKYRAIVEAFDGLIYVCSQDYRIEFMNERFITRTGSDATGKVCYRAIHDRDSICPWCVNERVFKGETVRWEIQSPKDGRWYYIVNTPIYHADGRISKQAMIMDITDKKLMEEELNKSIEKIKLFAYSVSHDLKSPAISIFGLTKLLHERYSEILDDRGKNYCKQIMKTAEQIAELVEMINVYITTKESPLCLDRVDLKETLKLVKAEFAVQLNIRQIDWLEPNTTPIIKADRLGLVRIFRNLIDNALKYGGDELSEIRIGVEESDAFYIISVSDNGVGIRQENSEKIFDLFHRDETSRGVQGTGLGLAIVKEVAEHHGGKVRVEAGSAAGTTFYVSIRKDL